MKTMVSRTLSVHNKHELLLKLGTAGLNNGLVQRVIDSKGSNLATKVVRLIQNDGYGFEPTSQKRAREIMGRSFGVEEVIERFGVNPTKRQLAVLSEIPFFEAVLEQLKDSRVLAAVFPLSILEMRGKVKELFYNGFCESAWYNKQSFAEERGEVGWRLVPANNNKTLKRWEVPTAQVMVYTIIGYFLATGERLFEDTDIRTSSVDREDFSVYVGRFDSRGLEINGCMVDRRYDVLGIRGPARKF